MHGKTYLKLALLYQSLLIKRQQTKPVTKIDHNPTQIRDEFDAPVFNLVQSNCVKEIFSHGCSNNVTIIQLIASNHQKQKEKFYYEEKYGNNRSCHPFSYCRPDCRAVFHQRHLGDIGDHFRHRGCHFLAHQPGWHLPSVHAFWVLNQEKINH